MGGGGTGSGGTLRALDLLPRHTQGVEIMTTYRVHKTEKYFSCPNAFLQDRDLSWRDKGILAYLLSRPNDWIVQIQDIVKQSKEGEMAVRGSIKNLRFYGYVSRRIDREGGKFVRFDYDVFESPELNPQYLVSAPFCENGEMVKKDKLTRYEGDVMWRQEVDGV